MRLLIEVPLDGRQSVVMEVDVDREDGVVRAARPGGIAATATESFADALERLQPLVHTLIAKLREIPDRPEEVTVQFGIKMTIGSGLVVAHTSGDASFQVTLAWRRQ